MKANFKINTTWRGVSQDTSTFVVTATQKGGNGDDEATRENLLFLADSVSLHAVQLIQFITHTYV